MNSLVNFTHVYQQPILQLQLYKGKWTTKQSEFFFRENAAPDKMVVKIWMNRLKHFDL